MGASRHVPNPKCSSIRRHSISALAVALALGHRAPVTVGLSHCLWGLGVLNVLGAAATGEEP